MKIAIVGWGVEGQSAYRYFGPEHDYLIVNEEPREDFPLESEKIKVRYIDTKRSPGLTGNVDDLSYLEGIEQCDKIIYSVTNAKNLEKLFGDDQNFWSKATTVTHIFFETVKSKNIIGITGSKGKGTTSTLIAELLKAGGKKVHLGGNIGLSVLDFLEDVQPEDWVVLELSNFQLYKLTHSPHIAVCLMISQEHMDWHSDMQEYVAAKANIFNYQAVDDIAIYFADDENSTNLAKRSRGKKIPYYQKPGAYVSKGAIFVGDPGTEVINVSNLKLLGEHNWQNVCAALTAVWQVSGDLVAIRKALTTFSGLEHRLQFVGELGGVKYYDDSFATTPDAAIVALKAFKEPKVIILGGFGKSTSFDKLADEIIKNDTRQVVAIGKTGPKIAELLRQKGFSNITEAPKNMGEIVAAAKLTAQPGDVVLLSPADSSFDMFKDYKERGNQFKTAVQALA